MRDGAYDSPRPDATLRMSQRQFKSDFLFALSGVDAKIIVATQIDFVVGRLFGVLIDIDVQIIIAQTSVRNDSFFLRRVKRQRLLRFEYRLRNPDISA